LQVVGVDTEVSSMLQRGLSAKTFLGPPLSSMSLAPSAGTQGFDAIVYYGPLLPSPQFYATRFILLSLSPVSDKSTT
jgi:hypothetical protein